MNVEVRKNDRGAWCVWIDGRLVSDHSTHSAARAAARNHLGLTTEPIRGGNR